MVLTPVPDDGDMNDRTCIVTRQTAQPEEMIRFVAGPDGKLVPDLKRRLPGRGCWVRAERCCVEMAVKRRLFAKALKTKLEVDQALSDVIDGLLVDDLVGMMKMARKAGQLVSGAKKTDNAVRSGMAIAVLHALDAADDGIRKIDQARHAQQMTAGDGGIPAFRLLESGALTAVFVQNAVIHVAVLAGQAGEGVVKRANALERYRGRLPQKPADKN